MFFVLTIRFDRHVCERCGSNAPAGSQLQRVCGEHCLRFLKHSCSERSYGKKRRMSKWAFNCNTAIVFKLNADFLQRFWKGRAKVSPEHTVVSAPSGHRRCEHGQDEHDQDESSY